LLILVAGLLSAVRLATIAADEESPAANSQKIADRSDTDHSDSDNSNSGKAKSGNLASTSIAAPDAAISHSDDKPTATKTPAAIVKNNPASVADLLAIQAGIEQAAAKGSPATVGISIGGFFGSGVIVTEDGYILTAGHVVSGPGHEAIIIFPDNKRVRAKTLGVNHAIDSGMLKIIDEGKYPHVELGRSADLKLGQWCVTLGHPGGFNKDRPPVVRAGRILYARDDAIGTDCTIVGGDSGGPLLDMSGRLIGIHSRISDDVTDNYHVPIDTYRETWDRLAKGDDWGGPPAPGGPLLGINGQTVPRLGETGQAGCKVTDVFPHTPADTAGIARDDLIISLGGDNVASLDSLQALITKRKAGDEVTVVILRDGEKKELKVKLSRRD
jgi:serine protease Do